MIVKDEHGKPYGFSFQILAALDLGYWPSVGSLGLNTDILAKQNQEILIYLFFWETKDPYWDAEGHLFVPVVAESLPWYGIINVSGCFLFIYNVAMWFLFSLDLQQKGGTSVPKTNTGG